jgi:deoxyribose-phosphate aldolase
MNQYIDHTLLKPDATAEQITTLCQEALEHQFMSVCVNSHYVPLAYKLLGKGQVKVCTVVGFPLGNSPASVKELEARWALDHGAQEIDMVMNIAAAKNGDWDLVEKDIELVAKTCHQKGSILKVIFETCLLTQDEIVEASKRSWAAGADFIKTSTGFSTSGASIEAVKLMRKTVGDNLGVKASGGIRDFETAQAMIEAGATRLGTSSGVAIMKNLKSESDY